MNLTSFKDLSKMVLENAQAYQFLGSQIYFFINNDLLIVTDNGLHKADVNYVYRSPNYDKPGSYRIAGEIRETEKRRTGLVYKLVRFAEDNNMWRI